MKVLSQIAFTAPLIAAGCGKEAPQATDPAPPTQHTQEAQDPQPMAEELTAPEPLPLPRFEADPSWRVIEAIPNARIANMFDYLVDGELSGGGGEANVSKVTQQWVREEAGPRGNVDNERLLAMRVLFRAPAGISSKALDGLWAVSWQIPNIMVAVPAEDGTDLGFFWYEQHEVPEPVSPEEKPSTEVIFPKDEVEPDDDPVPGWIRQRQREGELWLEVVADAKADTYGFRTRRDQTVKNHARTAFRGNALFANDQVKLAEYARVRDALVAALLDEAQGAKSIHVTTLATTRDGAGPHLPMAVVFLSRDAARLATEATPEESRPSVVVERYQ